MVKLFTVINVSLISESGIQLQKSPGDKHFQIPIVLLLFKRNQSNYLDRIVKITLAVIPLIACSYIPLHNQSLLLLQMASLQDMKTATPKNEA